MGLCLNASKAVSCLDTVGNDTSRSFVSLVAQNNVTLLDDGRSRPPSHEPSFTDVQPAGRWDHPITLASAKGRTQWHCDRRRNSELSVDDLRTWQGVVLGRAVSTLRSVETQPSAWGFVLSMRRDPEEKKNFFLCVERKIGGPIRAL